MSPACFRRCLDADAGRGYAGAAVVGLLHGRGAQPERAALRFQARLAGELAPGRAFFPFLLFHGSGHRLPGFGNGVRGKGLRDSLRRLAWAYWALCW